MEVTRVEGGIDSLGLAMAFLGSPESGGVGSVGNSNALYVHSEHCRMLSHA